MDENAAERHPVPFNGQHLAGRTRALYQHLVDLCTAPVPAAARLKQLERARPEVFELGRGLAGLLRHRQGAGEQRRADKAAKLITALHRRLIQGYCGLAQEERAKPQVRALLLQRALRSAQEIHCCALLDGQQAPAGLWRLLHRLHARARQLSLQAIEVDDPQAPGAQSQSLARGYLAALLLAGSGPLEMPRESLRLLIESLDALATAARLEGARGTDRWIIASDQDRPFLDIPANPEGRLALRLDEALEAIGHFKGFGGAGQGFDLKAHLQRCWSEEAPGPTWEACHSFAAILAQLGAPREEAALDARHFARQAMPQDVWAIHGNARVDLDEMVPHEDLIEFTPSTPTTPELPPPGLLSGMTKSPRGVCATWSGEAASRPAAGDLLGIRTAPTADWRLARVEQMAPAGNGQATLSLAWLSKQPRACRITLLGKLQESATHNALLLDDAGAKRILCPSLPLASGKKLRVEDGADRYLALLGASTGNGAEAPCFGLRRLALGIETSP
ncbi:MULTISPECIES: hypothetical protein [Pseudomonas]|uniref:hypothetical protein n=1 Tax=Pseudomonas TaxID=286 RepID=UPI0023D8C8DC|nr:hypothetical protein [Pseudomonas sp. 273]